MAELVYKNIISDLKEKIFAGKFTDMKLPDERSLAEQYNVSRSSVKRALNKMSNEGIIFKKRGSGTFINPLYLKNESIFNYEEGSNLGISDNFRLKGKKPQTKILDFQVIKPTSELQRDLFLSPEDFVYKIIRLRLFEDEPFMIETGYIPIKILPKLSRTQLESSIFAYIQSELNQTAASHSCRFMLSPQLQKIKIYSSLKKMNLSV